MQESEAPHNAKAYTGRMGFSLEHLNRKALVQWKGFHYKPTKQDAQNAINKLPVRYKKDYPEVR